MCVAFGECERVRRRAGGCSRGASMLVLDGEKHGVPQISAGKLGSRCASTVIKIRPWHRVAKCHMTLKALS